MIIELIKKQYTVENFCRLIKMDKTKLYRIDKDISKIKVCDLADICNELNINPLDIFKYHFTDRTYNDLIGLVNLQYERDVKDLLDKNQQQYLADALNGYMYTPGMCPKGSLKINIIDANIYEQLGDKWEIDVEELVKKIDKISEFEAYIIIKKIKEWWNKPDDERDIDNILV